MRDDWTAEAEVPCRCHECSIVHQEFISHFGRWPTMSHQDAQALKRSREENEASWREAGI